MINLLLELIAGSLSAHSSSVRFDQDLVRGDFGIYSIEYRDETLLLLWKPTLLMLTASKARIERAPKAAPF